MNKLAALVLAASAAACMPPRSSTVLLTSPGSVAHVATPTISLAPIVDARPASARRAHEPGVSSYWGLALVYFAFGSGRVDGIDQPGDDRTTITLDSKRANAPQAVEGYLRSVITSATGAAPAVAGEADVADVRRAAKGDGITIVPILDQYDDYRMFSEDSISGGSSYQTETHDVTVSGYSLGNAKTDVYANLRLRLVMLETRGGQVVRQATGYIATSGTGEGGMAKALEASVDPITAQLTAFVVK